MPGAESANKMVFESLTQNQVAIDILKTIVITVAVISSIVFVALFGRLPIFRCVRYAELKIGC